MSEIGLQRPSIVSPVRQRVAAGMPQHVRVGFKAELGLGTSTLDHTREPGRAEGCPSLRCEHER